MGGGAPPEQLFGLQLTSASMYGASAGSVLNTAHAWFACWYVPDQTPASATRCIAGHNNVSTAGAGVHTETTGGGNRGMTGGFLDNKYATIQARNYHTQADSEIGKHRRVDVWCTGSRVFASMFGCVLSLGTASTMTSFATTNAVAFNRRPASATLGFGAMTIVGMQFSTSVPTPAELAAARFDSPNKAIPGAIAHWAPADLGAAGATPSTWVDRIGGRSITITGSPAVIPVGRVASRWLTNVGATAAATGTQDFAWRHTAVGGQCLGPNNGTTPRLDTIATDLGNENHATGGTGYGYAINDFAWWCSLAGGSKTAQEAVDLLVADYSTLLTAHRLVRSGPVFIRNCLRAGTGGSGITATVQAAIDIYNAQFPAMIAALNAVHGLVFGRDWCSAVTGTQAAADDLAVLYDRVHMTAASKALAGEVDRLAIIAAGYSHIVMEWFGDSLDASRESGGSTDGVLRRAMTNDFCAAA